MSLSDLIEADLLFSDQELTMLYKPRSGEQKVYTARLRSDGSIDFMGNIYSSPRYATIRGINDAGSDRKTVNGWTSWQLPDGRTLADIRSDFLDKNTENAI